LSKILAEVKEVEKAIDYNTSLLERLYTETENLLKNDPKADSLTKAILKLFNEYKTTFESTLQNLRDQGKKKLDSREIEQKIDLLSTKGFKNIISKLQVDLKSLQEDNKRISLQMNIQYK